MASTEDNWLDIGDSSKITTTAKLPNENARGKAITKRQSGKSRSWVCDGEYVWFRRNKANPAIKQRLTDPLRLPYNFIKGPIIGWTAPKAFVSDMGFFTLPQLALSTPGVAEAFTSPGAILAVAGLPVPADMQGRSLVPLLREERPPDWRTAFYYRYYHDPGDHNTPAHYGMRTETHKLIRYWKSDQWELFDLLKDPAELHNLYADPASQPLVGQLKSQLLRLKEEVQDHDEFADKQPPAGVDGPFPELANRPPANAPSR